MLAEKLWSFRRSSDSSVLVIGWQERAELVLPFRALQDRSEGAIHGSIRVRACLVRMLHKPIRSLKFCVSRSEIFAN
jgi:hypothetical protein